MSWAGKAFWFWNLVKREHRTVTVSRAVLVDGGLSPPPSKIYPGTKCYIVTVAVDNKEHSGFGPTPSIAQRAAVLEAYKFLRAREPLDSSSKCLAGEKGKDNEDDFLSQATPPPDIYEPGLHPVAHHHKNVDGKNVDGSVPHQCEDTGPNPHNDCLGRLSRVQHPPHLIVSHHKYPPRPNIQHCNDAEHSADNVLDALLDMAQRKSVDIKFEFLFFTTEVVALVLGGGLSFVGKHQEKHLAGREAALKMLEALEKWPDLPPLQVNRSVPIEQFQRPPGLPPLLPWLSCRPHLSPPAYFPNCPRPLPYAVPAPRNDFRPPFLPLLPLPPPPYFPAIPHNAPFHPPLDHSCSPRRFRPCPPQLADVGGSSSEDDGDSQQLSQGLSEVVPSRCASSSKAHRTEEVLITDKVTGEDLNGKTTVSNLTPHLERHEKKKSPFGKNLPFSVVSPFESSSPYSDPFMFTVRVPRTRNSPHSEKPPWKKIQSSVTALLPPASGVDSKEFANEFSPGEKQEVVACSKPEEAATSPAVVSMPAHFLLPLGDGLDVESSPRKGDAFPVHFLFPVAENLESKPLPTHFLLQNESLPLHNGGREDLLDNNCTERDLPMNSGPGITRHDDIQEDEGVSEQQSEWYKGLDNKGQDRAQLSGRDKVQDKGQDKTQDKRLSGQDKGQDKAQDKRLSGQGKGQDEAQDKQLSGQDKVQDKGLSEQEMAQDKQVQHQDKAQDEGLSKWDKQVEQRDNKQLSEWEMVQDKRLSGRDKAQDKQVEQQDNAGLSKWDRAQDKRLSGRDKAWDKRLSGQDEAQDKQRDEAQEKQLSGLDKAWDKRLSGRDKARDKQLSGRDKEPRVQGLFGSFSFASAQDRVNRMMAGEVCVGMPTEGPCTA